MLEKKTLKNSDTLFKICLYQTVYVELAFDFVHLSSLLTQQTERPIHDIKKNVHGSKEKEHASINPPSSSFFFNIPHSTLTKDSHPDQGQLEHVDDNCPENEEEVDKNPESKGRYTLRNLWRRCSLLVCVV